tara:strand:+ start:296 stop:649 length:354 start_codon:yes stop_codon:yes gene_type:complete
MEGLPEELRTKVNARLEYLSADDKAFHERLQEVVSTRPNDDLVEQNEIACPKSYQQLTWHVTYYSSLDKKTLNFLGRVPREIPITPRNYNSVCAIEAMLAKHEKGSDKILITRVLPH